MITCEHAQNMFEAYLNDEAPPSLVAELDAHCLGCSSCRQQLSLLEACGNVVRLDTSEPAVAGDFTDRLVRILDEDRSRRRSLQLSRHMKLAGGLLGVAAAIAIAINVAWLSPEPIPQVKGAHTGVDADVAEVVPVSVPGVLLSDFTGAPLPLLQMPHGLSAFLELGELTLDKLNDAAAAEQPASIESLPLAPRPGDGGPDVLETLPPLDEDDGGELM